MSMNMRFLIGDCETMGVNENSVILDFSFVAVDFNKRLDYTQDELRELSVKWKFDAKEQLDRGRTVDQDTMEWWRKQDKDVRQRCVLPSEHDVSLYSLFDRLKEYLRDNDFSNRGPKASNFWFATRGELEPKVIHHIYQQNGSSLQQEGFYDYYRWRDVRTMLHFLTGTENGYLSVSDECKGIQKHDSRDDIILDCLQMQKALRGYA